MGQSRKNDQSLSNYLSHLVDYQQGRTLQRVSNENQTRNGRGLAPRVTASLTVDGYFYPVARTTLSGFRMIYRLGGAAILPHLLA